MSLGLHNMISYASCRPLLRTCNKYILNRERKVFNYLWLYFLCGEFTFKTEYSFVVLANAAKYKRNPSKYALNCSKMQLWWYRIGDMPLDPSRIMVLTVPRNNKKMAPTDNQVIWSKVMVIVNFSTHAWNFILISSNSITLRTLYFHSSINHFSKNALHVRGTTHSLYI